MEMQIINEEGFFRGLGFKKHTMEYRFGARVCFESPSGHFFRIDHFSDMYVIEFAENEAEASRNMFEDGNCYRDDTPMEELVEEIQQAILSDE